jgi:hypothetical protein
MRLHFKLFEVILYGLNIVSGTPLEEAILNTTYRLPHAALTTSCFPRGKLWRKCQVGDTDTRCLEVMEFVNGTCLLTND